jgi:hypothetical protein
MASLFGRYEAALLLAVERANGGELAPLEQVISAYEQLFGASVGAPTFAESVWLLVDARLIEWASGGLALTYDGRKVIRRSGVHWAEDFPDRVAGTLSSIDETDLAPEGELPAPTEEEVAEAMVSLRQGRMSGTIALPAEEISPSRMAGVQSIGARMLTGLPAGMSLSLPGSPGASGPPLLSPLGTGAGTGTGTGTAAKDEDAGEWDWNEEDEEDEEHGEQDGGGPRPTA